VPGLGELAGSRLTPVEEFVPQIHDFGFYFSEPLVVGFVKAFETLIHRNHLERVA